MKLRALPDPDFLPALDTRHALNRPASGLAAGPRALLLATVIGSGIMGERLAGGNVAIALLGNTIPTGAILIVLITMLGPISGAHFNPAVTVVFAIKGEMSSSEALGYVVVQVLGGVGPFSNTFAGIRPQNVPPFVIAQLIGAVAAVYVCRWLLADPGRVTAERSPAE